MPTTPDAERNLLASVMIDPGLVDDYDLSRTPAEAFWSESNRVLWTHLMHLHWNDYPIDLPSVMESLRQAGDMNKVGGPAYVIGVMSDADGVGSNANHYANIVLDAYRRRQLITHCGEAINTAVTDGYETARDNLQTNIYKIDDSHEAGLDEAISIAEQFIDGQEAARLPTGFKGVDLMIGGLPIGDLTTLAGRTSMGKALALDTRVPTPNGMTTMGALSVGDFVYGPDGAPTRVVAATDTLMNRPCFQLTFSTGETVIADAQHQWRTNRHRSKRSDGIRTTQEIYEDTTRHHIPVAEPIQGWQAMLDFMPFDPYTLGVWLGDGHSACARITIADRDADILDRIKANGIPVSHPREIRENCATYTLSTGDRSQDARNRSPQAILRALGVLNNKHIPTAYLQAPIPQRLELLRGLVDTDGHVMKNQGTVVIDLMDERLSRDTYQLVASLGMRPSISTKRARLDGRDVGTVYRVTFTPDSSLPNVATVPFKASRTAYGTRTTARSIESITPVASMPVRCIQVSREDGLFLITDGHIPTHNSALAHNIAFQVGNTHVLTPDQPLPEILISEACRRSRISYEQIRAGNVREDQKQAWRDAFQKVKEEMRTRVTFDDRHLTFTRMVSEVRKAARRGKKLVIVDHVQHVRPTNHRDKRTLMIDITGSLKSLARDENISVLALSQLTRDIDHRPEKRPLLVDLSESKTLEEDANVVLFLYREGYYNPSAPDNNLAELIVGKSKTSARLNMAQLLWNDRFMEFQDVTV